MKEKESSYYKLFIFALGVVICVLLGMGIIMISIFSAVYKNTKLEEMKTAGDLFSSCVKASYDANGYITTEAVLELQDQFMNEYGADIFLYDGYGNCVLAANDSSRDHLSDELKDLLSGDDYLDVYSKAYAKDQPKLLYGTMFYLRTGLVDPQKAYVLLYRSTEDISSFTVMTVLVYTAFAMICIFLSYLILKRRIRRHSNFESEFMRITEKYSKGDFSETIPTNMNGRLKELADRINSLASDIESSEDTSKTFIANVSHELRTPMTTIGGFVDAILDGTIKKSQQQEYLIIVSNEIKRLRIVISSMLNMTRFESGTLSPNFRETNLTDLVIQTVLMFEKRIEDKGLSVEELDSSRLMAVVDADLMQQVIYNLVENAVKFVNEGGTLSFSFEEVDGICMIGIRNTGEGLKNTEIQQVFDRFYKTDSSRGKDITGLGLGLSISRKIVHLHNGHIVVKSVYGEYTEFQIQIPKDPRNVKE
ncbi:MAG: HAMP domain-containing histidine kinase [Ruminococcus sp.]|nr:HAMP domain-containing histidine kinase [Ruminococcus sp.]